MKEFSCKHYLTQQVDSRCVIFLFYLLWQTHELPTVTVVSSPSQPALLFSATYVSACVCTCSVWQWHFGLFFPVLVCFELFVFFVVVVFVFSWRLWTHRAEVEFKSVRIWTVCCWWQGLIGYGRCGKRFPSDDGLTVVIVMMHFAWFFFFPLHLEKKKINILSLKITWMKRLSEHAFSLTSDYYI